MNTSILNAAGERLAYTYVEGAPGAPEVVVIGHGLTSDRTRPWSEALSTALASRGIASLRLAFSGNGDSEGRFVDSNITKELGDLGAVLDALEGRRVAYVGHSMGAAVGVLRAADDARILALVSLAGMVHTAAFFSALFEGLEPGDLLLDKPGKPLGPALRDDLLALQSVGPRAREVAVPWLLVHGDADDVVPLQHSRDAHSLAREGTCLVELAGADHSFTGDDVARLAAVVAPWLADALGCAP